MASPSDSGQKTQTAKKGFTAVRYPTWQSPVNVTDFVTVKPSLEDDERVNNFRIWKKQMLCLLESQGLLGAISENAAITSTSHEEMASSNVQSEHKLMWRRTDAIVKGWILGSIGKDALGALLELETAREVWLELEKMFRDEAEDQSGGDVSRYLPLYIAAQRGDWETARNFFDRDEEAATAIITCDSETALHVAVSTGKANDFVNKLVELMPPEALAKKNSDGDTALHCAANAGNTIAARTLVSKNPDLLYIVNNINRLPVTEVAVYCHKDTLEYLISCMSKPNAEQSPFEGQLGIRLLIEVICSELFDVALDLVASHPDLARSQREDGFTPLSAIADMSSVFPSAESFCWWQKFIYNRIPLKQSEQEAAQATSVAGDIENGIRDAPAYNKCSGLFQNISKGIDQEDGNHALERHRTMPRVKGIREKKVVHQQALELVKCMCQLLVSLPENEASTIFRDAIIKAAKYGISEIVELIMEMYPLVIFSVDADTGKNVFLMAASNRFENVFNLIYNMSDRKYQIFDSVDNENNNLMHICAKLAPPDRLNLVPGAALQMQRELQWFMEMMKYVHPSRRIWTNNNNETPNMLFTREHRQLKEEGERWMKDTANACSIAAVLIGGVVFAALFTVPGGVKAETGAPVFSDQFAFILFAISDAVSLFTSITALLMFLSILASRYAEEDFLYVLPKRLSIGLLSLFLSITFMMVAFSATLYLIFRGKVKWFLIPVAAIACLPVTSFVLLQFPLLFDVVYSTYGPGIFGKKSDRHLY